VADVYLNCVGLNEKFVEGKLIYIYDISSKNHGTNNMEHINQLSHQKNWKKALIYIMNTNSSYCYDESMIQAGEDLKGIFKVKEFLNSFLVIKPEVINRMSHYDLNRIANVMVNLLADFGYVKVSKGAQLILVDITSNGVEIALKLQEHDDNNKRFNQQKWISIGALIVSSIALFGLAANTWNSIERLNYIVKSSETNAKRLALVEEKVILTKEPFQVHQSIKVETIKPAREDTQKEGLDTREKLKHES
jgi:hypothetical protein